MARLLYIVLVLSCVLSCRDESSGSLSGRCSGSKFSALPEEEFCASACEPDSYACDSFDEGSSFILHYFTTTVSGDTLLWKEVYLRLPKSVFGALSAK